MDTGLVLVVKAKSPRTSESKEARRIKHSHAEGKLRLGEGKAESLVPYCPARSTLQALSQRVRRDPHMLKNAPIKSFILQARGPQKLKH